MNQQVLMKKIKKMQEEMIQTQQESFEFELIVDERDNVKSPNNHKESAAGSVDGFVKFRHDVFPQLGKSELALREC